VGVIRTASGLAVDGDVSAITGTRMAVAETSGDEDQSSSLSTDCDLCWGGDGCGSQNGHHEGGDKAGLEKHFDRLKINKYKGYRSYRKC
jgi:hypothetical protein